MNKQTQADFRTASPFKTRYDNFIGGTFVPPVGGRYMDNITPITGLKICEVARSGPEDIEKALDAAHAAKEAWGKTSPAQRSNILLKIADRLEANLDLLAAAETWDNGKPIRETVNADIPLSVDHFRYFAGVLRGQEGTMSEIDHDTVAYHFHEPLGVVGQIIPWNFSILMAAWKLAPALAAGNCIVMKPAEQTPAAILVLAELIADLLSRSQLIQLMYQSGHSAEHSQSEHIEIVAALARRDGRAAARLMEQHVNSVERNLRLDPRTPDLAAVLRPPKP